MALGITLSPRAYNTLRTPFLYAAILITAWFGGMGPGLLAVALATFSARVLFRASVHSSQAAEIIDLPLVVSFPCWPSHPGKRKRRAYRERSKKERGTTTDPAR